MDLVDPQQLKTILDCIDSLLNIGAHAFVFYKALK